MLTEQHVRLGKRWWVLPGDLALLTLIGSALLIGLPHLVIAATLTTEEMTQVLFSGTLFGSTTSGCRFGIPALGLNVDTMTVTWSGACVEDQVSGLGTLRGMRSEQEAFSFVGEMRNGLPDGEGIYHLAGLITFTGRFHGPTLEGEHSVISTEKGFRYEGAVRTSVPEGFGVGVFPDGTHYEGQWHDGKREGRGISTWISGDRYEGEWHAGRRSGQGVLTYKSGSRYEGDFQEGKRDGHGVFTMPTGERVEAQSQNDAPNGLGSIVKTTTGDRYDGELRGGLPNGKGIMLRADGSRYEGELSNGKYDGVGTLTRPNEVPFTGTWMQGCFSDRSRRRDLGPSQQACQ